MRLFDTILHSDNVANGQQSAADEQAVEEIRNADTRFVLDRAASRACADLIRNAADLFHADNSLFRMPGEAIWLEAFQEGEDDEDDSATARFGALVRSDPDGRSGYLRHFSEDKANGSFVRYPVWTEFDLDRPLQPRDSSTFPICHSLFAHMSEFLRHTMLHVEPEHLDQLGILERAGRVRHFGEAVWFDFPVVCAFAALLQSPGIVDTRPSDLGRLNQARARRNRPPLHDHVEVRLVLGGATHDPSGTAIGRRMAPRLHYVRGHFVNRSGKVFWRSPHLRGDSNKAVIQRTVRVTAASGLRR